MNTETLDKIYLEWSQFTQARTQRETQALALLTKIYHGNIGVGQDEVREMIAKLEPSMFVNYGVGLQYFKDRERRARYGGKTSAK